ncbi:hypothetical protein RBU55_11865 [Pseudomonas chlororaphis subsp. aurantiaca]|uniref:hypothetical protein n=1 Tax=Pseudomonas chlororaphis TaxID=587753 RepID=UPI0027DBE3FD|nr:hypothetical protein [Pseudomonas chlororaphis]WMJ02214.1 hypothetical protein RBU55_11865 [Pseudomonas chlororaphis subsp. aurantiaca]
MSIPSQIGPIEVSAKRSCVSSTFEIEAGHRYRFLVEGLWADASDPPTKPEGLAHPGGIRERLGWAKRLPEAAWMALLVRTKGPKGKSPWRLLGGGDQVWSDLPPGRLQFCANDVLGFYWNNSGKMNVRVIDVTDG